MSIVVRGRLPLNPPSVNVYGCLSDAHFLLDLLVIFWGYKGLERIIEEENIGADLSQPHPAIASYVYFNSWDKSSKDSLKHTSFTLLASIQKDPKFLLPHLEWDCKCVGIGEVGLDYTTSCGCMHHHNERQEKYYK